MATHTILQEIILPSARGAFRQGFANNAGALNIASLPVHELEAACKQGVLPSLLPGIMEKSHPKNKLYLSRVRRGTSYLQIEVCQYPMHVDEAFSIDAELCLPTLRYN